jgi:hypothetical protein
MSSIVSFAQRKGPAVGKERRRVDATQGPQLLHYALLARKGSRLRRQKTWAGPVNRERELC